MKLERTENAVRNVKFGVLQKIFQIVFPFLMRTIMYQTLGANYLGLNGLFTSVLQVLNLAELGVGSAMVYSMYEPIVKDDTETICALLRLYRIYYRIIGLVVAVVGIMITPAVPFLVRHAVPEGMDIYVLYWMNLAGTVLSYWLFAYKNSLLLAFQRNDIMSKIAITTSILQNFLQLAVLLIFKDYYVFLAVMLLTQMVNNLMTALVVARLYPEYRPKGRLSGELTQSINRRIVDLFTSKVGSVIVNDADTIVISAFLGLPMLAVYQNYYYILTAVVALVSILFSACMAGIGNSLIVEGKKKNLHDFQMLTFIILWITCFCTSMLLNLYQPFMIMWMGEDQLLSMGVVGMLCVYYFTYEINRLFNTFKDAGGIWHKDRFRPLVTALSNLGLNLLLVQVMGIYGIVISTIVSTLIVGMPWLLHNLFHEIFSPDDLWPYVRRLAMDVLSVAVVIGVTYLACGVVSASGFWELVIKALLCAGLSNGLLVVLWGRRQEFRGCLGLVQRVLGKGNKKQH